MSNVVGFIGRNYYIKLDKFKDCILVDKIHNLEYPKDAIYQDRAYEIVNQLTETAIESAKTL